MINHGETINVELRAEARRPGSHSADATRESVLSAHDNHLTIRYDDGQHNLLNLLDYLEVAGSVI